MSKNKKKKINNKKRKNAVKKKRINNAKANSKKAIVKTPKKNLEIELLKKEITEETKEIELPKIEEETIKLKKEKKCKGIVVRIFCILFLIILIGFIIFPRQKEEDIIFNVINLNEYMDLYTKGSLEYIFIIDENCKNCDTSRKNLQRLENEFSIKINELNIHDLSKDDIIKLQDSNSSLKENINIPILLSIKNGKEIGQINAAKEYSALKKFANYSLNPIEINSFNKITINKYLSLLKSEDITIIYIGNSINNECKNFSAILESVSQELNFKVNYIDTDSITKPEDWEKLNNSNKIFEDNWFMPAILIIKQGNIVAYKMESVDKDSLVKFFERYGL